MSSSYHKPLPAREAPDHSDERSQTLAALVSALPVSLVAAVLPSRAVEPVVNQRAGVPGRNASRWVGVVD